MFEQLKTTITILLLYCDYFFKLETLIYLFSYFL